MAAPGAPPDDLLALAVAPGSAPPAWEGLVAAVTVCAVRAGDCGPAARVAGGGCSAEAGDGCSRRDDSGRVELVSAGAVWDAELLEVDVRLDAGDFHFGVREVAAAPTGGARGLPAASSTGDEGADAADASARARGGVAASDVMCSTNTHVAVFARGERVLPAVPREFRFGAGEAVTLRVDRRRGLVYYVLRGRVAPTQFRFDPAARHRIVPVFFLHDAGARFTVVGVRASSYAVGAPAVSDSAVSERAVSERAGKAAAGAESKMREKNAAVRNASVRTLPVRGV